MAQAPVRFIEDYLLYLLARASHGISAEFHAQLRARRVPVPVWRVLATLSGVADETVSGLADACLAQQPTMTKLLDRMARDGLVSRRPDAYDRRVVRVALTAEGRAQVQELLAAAKQHEATVLARHPPEEAAQIKNMLRRIITQQAAPPGV